MDILSGTQRLPQKGDGPVGPGSVDPWGSAMMQASKSDLAPTSRLSVAQSAIPVIDRCVHELIVEEAQRHPDSEAIFSLEGSLTYRELDLLSCNLSHELSRRGVGPGTYTCFSFEKSANAVIAMLAILRAGAACIPLDISLPPERIWRILDQSGARMIVCSTQQASRLQQVAAVELAVVDSTTLSSLPQYQESPCQTVPAPDAAYVLYTSGSTGSPKGCIWSHTTLSSSAIADGVAVGLNRSSRVFQYAAFMWDASVMETLFALTHGGCVCVPSEEMRLNKPLEFMTWARVNWTVLTPTFARSVPLEEVDCLKTLCLGGEPIGQDNIDKYRNKFRLLSLYGPSECCIIVAVADHGADGTLTSGNLGHGTSARLWIVDPEDPHCLLPDGSDGEVLIEGPGVGRGYLGDPVQTTSSFFRGLDWAQTPESTAFRSGDLGRRNHDGTVTIIGRKDDQVKVRGQRLELGDVERNLLQCAGVRHAMAFVPSSSRHAGRLVAILDLGDNEYVDTISPAPEQPFLDGIVGVRIARQRPSDQRDYRNIERILSERLPPFGVPSVWLPMDHVPVTLGGKLDRIRLRDWAVTKLDTIQSTAEDPSDLHESDADESSAPLTEAEHSLRNALARVLQIHADDIKMKHSFQKLRGDSIQGLRLVSLLRSHGHSLALTDLFGCSNLREMAGRMAPVVKRKKTKPFSVLYPGDSERLTILLEEAASECFLQVSDIEDIYPATPAQETFWLSDIAHAGGSSIRLVYRPTHEVSADALQVAWKAMTEAHAILRTRVVHLSNQRTYQVVARTAAPMIQVEDWTDFATCDRQEASMGGHLCSLTQTGPYVVLDVHHACYDGVSLPLAVDDLIRACYGDRLKRLPAFRDFIKVVMDPAKNEAGEQYWRKAMSGARETRFPNVPGRSASLADSLKRSSLKFPQPQYPISVVVHAAWALLLSACDGSDDVTFGSVLNGRDAAVDKITDMPGPTMATMPLRCVINREQPIEEYLGDVQRRSLDAMEHQHFGIQNIQRLSQDAEAACKFHTYVNVVPSSPSGTDRRWKLDAEKSSNTLVNFSRYDITLQVLQNAEGADLVMLYSPSLLSSRQADCLFQAFEDMFRQLAAASDQLVVSDIIPQGLLSLRDVSHNPNGTIFGPQLYNPANGSERGIANEDLDSRSLDERTPSDVLYNTPPQESAEYWRDYLSDCEPCCIPFGNEEGTPTEMASIDDVNVPQLRDFCRKHNTNPSDTISAIWALLLAAYTAEDSTCFGYLQCNDITQDSPSKPAPGVKMLIRRIGIDATESFAALTDRTQEDSLASLQHCDIPIQSMLEGSPRNASMFNTALSFQVSSPSSPQDRISTHVKQLEDEDDTLRWSGNPIDLLLDVCFAAEGLRVHLNRSRNVGYTFGVRIMKTLVSILKTVLSTPEACYMGLDLTSTDDKSQIVKWNECNIEVDNPDDTFVHSRISAQARLIPHQLAVVASDGSLTYQELDRMSTNLAHHLVDLGIKIGDSVPYCLERSVWAAVVIVAIMKSGAAFTPLNPEDPIQRQMTLLEKCHARCIIISPTCRDMFADVAMPIVVADPQFFDELPGKDGAACQDLNPASIAYALFTSGSTGAAKTVLVDHSAWTRYNVSLESLLHYKPGMRALQFASYVWDVSLSELITPLVYGGTAYIPSEDERLYNLGNFINMHRIDWMYITPSVARTVVPAEVPSLKTLTLVGEPIRQIDLEQWQSYVRLQAHYGACEMACYTTVAEFQSESRKSPRNIGRGVNGSQFYLVDARDPRRLAPIGAIGEIVVVGAHLAVGYLDDEHKTAESFIEGLSWIDGSTGNHKRRGFRTGDLARYNSDGSMDYIARKGGFVKLRGQRLELGSIEERILRCPSVKHTICTVPERGLLKRQLVCVAVLANDQLSAAAKTLRTTDSSLSGRSSIFIQEMRDCIAQDAPVYARPDVWIVVEALPYNASRKISRKAVHGWLTDSDMDVLSGTISSTPVEIPLPETETEKKIQAVWAGTLDIPSDQIHIDRDFLSHGGDSISSIRLVSALRRAGFSVTARDVLQGLTVSSIACKAENFSSGHRTPAHPTPDSDIKAVADAVDVAVESDPYINGDDVWGAPYRGEPSTGDNVDPSREALVCESLPPSWNASNVEAVHGCSPLQDGIITSQFSSPERYTLSMIIRLERKSDISSRLTVAQLEMAWIRAVAQHPTLRTTFTDSSSLMTLFSQVILKHYSPKATKLSAQSEEEAVSILQSQQLAFEDDQPPHHLAICGLNDSPAVLCRLDISHACVDGLSLSLIWRDICLACDSELLSQPMQSYGIYVDDMRQNLDVAAASQYWKDLLRKATPCNIPVSPAQKFTIRRPEAFLVPFTEVSELQSFCRATSLTAASVLRAAWSIVLSLLTEQESCCFGYVSSGRDLTTLDMQGVVGPFLNILLCATTVSPKQTVRALIGDVQTSFIESLPHQFAAFTPFAQESLRGGGRLFNSVVSVWPMAFRPHGTSNSIEYSCLQMQDPTEYDLALTAMFTAASSKIEMSADLHQLSADQSRRIAAALGQVLHSIITVDSSAIVSSVSAFGAAALRGDHV